MSLYTPAYGENADLEDKEALVDVMYQNKISNPEKLVIDKGSTNMLEYELVRHLSQFEKDVLDLYLFDFNYLQIADKLKKDPKSIDNALQRIKLKLHKVLKEFY